MGGLKQLLITIADEGRKIICNELRIISFQNYCCPNVAIMSSKKYKSELCRSYSSTNPACHH